MHISNHRNRNLSSSLVLSGLLLFATAAVSAAQSDLVRSDFRTDDTAVFSHGTAGVYPDGAGGFVCTDGEGIVFDYADAQDDCSPDPVGDEVGSEASKGGGWSHASGPVREIALDFSSPLDAGDCAALESLPLGCTCGEPCGRRVWLAADRVFKKKATRQTLGGRFDVFPKAGGGPPEWRIDYVDPLYLCSPSEIGESLAGDWRVMQSVDCSGGGDVSLAEVVDASNNQVVGEWYLPIQVLLQRVAAPSDGGGDPPSPGCTDADADGFCAEVDDCDDGDANVHPGHQDSKGRWGRDGVDNDCNGVIDG